MGCRSGYKDKHGQCVMDKLPGLLSELMGTDCPEYLLISPEVRSVAAEWEGDKLETIVFNDILAPLGDAEVVGYYTESYYAGAPALIRNRYGKGETYYYGGAFTEESVSVFLKKLQIVEPYEKIIGLPRCCEIAMRVKDDCRYLFVLNYSETAQKIQLKQTMENLFTATEEAGVQILEAYETRVYKICKFSS